MININQKIKKKIIHKIGVIIKYKSQITRAIRLQK